MPAKVFGPTDSVAVTLTQIGSTYQASPGDWSIYRIRIGFGNVVNAKTCSGHLHIETVERTYDFAFGNGLGGATNATSGPAEEINLEPKGIHVPGNSSVKAYVIQTYASKNVTVGIQFRPGGANEFRTLAGGGADANADTAAATEEAFTTSAKLTGSSFQPAKNGRIYRIRFAGAGIIDAKANVAKIVVNVPGVAGPYEYVVGSGPGGATLGNNNPADVIEIPEGIPVSAQGTILVNITSAEIMISPVISLEYW
jgi:hypothetical protein